MSYKKVKYLPTRVSFDVETTSLVVGGEKRAFPYSFTVCVNGRVTVLRTVSEFVSFVKNVRDKSVIALGLETDILCVYVHNLGFEFPFIRAYFQWDNVFCIGSKRRVARARTKCGIEFRCSLLLTGKKLADVGKDVGVPKLVGDLDYSLVRHSETQLSDSELAYIHNDVLILDKLIAEKLSEHKNYNSIPMTSTGYVRRYFRGLVRKSDDDKLIKKLVLSDSDYVMARMAFSGGYVHANANYATKVVSNVVAYDISSSYPASMVSFKFPMSVFVECDPSRFNEVFRQLACLTTVKFNNIESKYPFPPISSSKTVELRNGDIDNGRVFSADSLTVTVNDIELSTIMRAYDYDDMTILRLKCAKYDYLPNSIVQGVLKLFSDKTTLKNVPGREVDYKLSKAYINSVYGMSATDPVMTNFISDDNGIVVESEPDVRIEVDAHNDSRSRFLFYPWSSWITAYSRMRLLNTIFNICDNGGTVLYCDTDSIYAVESDTVVNCIEKENKNNIERLQTVSIESNFNVKLATPMDPSGVKHVLGSWERDSVEPYFAFKTLGAKRYAYQEKADSNVNITVAGLPKEDGARWINNNGGMVAFNDGLTIPPNAITKLSLSYFDDSFTTVLRDYQGNIARVEQTGGVHMLNIGFNLTMSNTYVDFINVRR